MNKPLIAATVLTVSSALAVAFDPPGASAQTGTSAQPAAKASSTKQFRFTPLKEPKPLPEIRFEDVNGRKLTLANFRGKVVLLNIWATWCPPCREEMPSLDRLQAKLGGPGFEVVPLSIDRSDIFVVKSFYEELGLKALRMYIDKTSKVTGDLGVVGLPTTLLVDRKGREIGRLVGPAEWDSPEAIAVIRRYMDAP